MRYMLGLRAHAPLAALATAERTLTFRSLEYA